MRVLTRPPTFGENDEINAPVAVSKAATRLRVAPPTEVKSPAMYNREPSGDAATDSTWALAGAANPVLSRPVARS
jgi:hypothetical protein